jgi:hypothetical protein
MVFNAAVVFPQWYSDYTIEYNTFWTDKYDL